jgi:hypothetical protein
MQIRIHGTSPDEIHILTMRYEWHNSRPNILLF